MDNFVPEVHRAGVMTQEHEIEMFLAEQLFQTPAPGGIQQERIEFSALQSGGRFIAALGGDDRQEFERKLCLRLERGKLRFNVRSFPGSIVLALDATPIAPAGMLFALRRFVSQHGLHAERRAIAWVTRRTGVRLGRSDIKGGHGQPARGESTDVVEEPAAVYGLELGEGERATTVAGAATVVMVRAHRHREV